MIATAFDRALDLLVATTAPHRVTGGTLVVRNGPPYRAAVPVADPVWVTRLAIASDDPEALVAALRAASEPARRTFRRRLLDPAFVAGDLIASAC